MDRIRWADGALSGARQPVEIDVGSEGFAVGLQGCAAQFRQLTMFSRMNRAVLTKKRKSVRDSSPKLPKMGL